MAQLLEAAHVEGNVVVDQEDGACSVIAGIADVTQYALKRIRMEVSPPNFNNGTETAIVGAATRGFDHIHLATQQSVALEHPSRTIRQADLVTLQSMHRPSGVMDPTAAFAMPE